jgi:hypothetical protein
VEPLDRAPRDALEHDRLAHVTRDGHHLPAERLALTRDLVERFLPTGSQDEGGSLRAHATAVARPMPLDAP